MKRILNLMRPPNTPRRWRLRAVIGLFPMILAAGPLLAEQPGISKEYQVKALFLYNFAQFVKWPPDTFSGAEDPFCIGVLGNDPFGPFLDETVRGEKVDGHPLVIRRYDSVAAVKACQILFISRSETGQMDKTLTKLRGRNILTVGDVEGFIKNGGIIRFVHEGNRIHFRVNLAAAKELSLEISSKMLRLAEITGPGRD